MTRRFWLALVAAALAPGMLGAQEPAVTVVAGPQYEAGALKNVFLGDDYRDLWTTPIRVPVLNLATHGGGLTVEKRGGRQSHTLHFVGGDGREYIFRSVDKFLYKAALPADLRHTPAGAIAQDQTSSLHPGAAAAVSPLQAALGILHPPPRLVVMPDDPRLGEHRDLFAGMLGWIEEKPNEGDDDTPGFGGSTKVVGAEKFFENIDEHPKHQLATEEYLATRLLDFIIGDTDRGGDQWRFARYDRGEGYVWRPVPRDRDYAFMHADGALMKIVRMAYPKMEVYGPTLSNIRSMTFMTRDMDRRLLVGLSKDQWDAVVASVQARLTEDVLRDAVSRMPPEYRERSEERVLEGLRGRRDTLDGIADEFYALIAREAEIHTTDEPELATAEWQPDGAVVVRVVHAPAGQATDGRRSPFFDRRFVPTETREIRLYMHGKDDRVVVRGARTSAIRLRVIGGGGDDVLADSTTNGPGSVAFFDHRGDNEFVTTAATKVSEKEFDHPPAGRPQDLMREQLMAEAAAEQGGGEEGDEAPVEDGDDGSGEDPDADPEGWLRSRLMPEFVQDFGSKSGVRATADYREGAGPIVGLGYAWRQFGFRYVPNKLYARVTALYALQGGFGAEGVLQRNLQNSAWSLGVRARATQFDTFRFFGFGNDTPEIEDLDRTLVERDRARARAYVRRALTDQGFLEFGPELRHTDRGPDPIGEPDVLLDPIPHAEQIAVFHRTAALGGKHNWAGFGFDALIRRTDGSAVPHRGLVLLAGGAAYPKALDLPSAYGTARAEVRTYVPLGSRPHLALRVGGAGVWGDHFAIEDAAYLGGRFDLRGYEYNRFVGERAAFGNAELRVPVGRAELFVGGNVGIFALADAGRVWFDGESPGGWHTAYGGGLWFASLGRAVSVAYARGEIGQLYISFGLPY